MSLEDMKARLAALRSARPAAPTSIRPPAVAAVRVRVSLGKPPDAAAPGSPALATAARPGASFEVPPLGSRAMALSRKQMGREAKLDRARLGPKEPPIDVDAGRPRTRGDCFGGPRPCPYVSCRYHTYLDVTEAGSLVINRPDIDVADLKASCALDIADQGGIMLEAVGAVLGVTRERVRQFEEETLAKASARLAPKFRGSCKARCAETGLRCQLPAHDDDVHASERGPFYVTAEPGQTEFAAKRRVEDASRRVPVDPMEAAHV
jgi:hypothetical protein